jgi:hypothetical protein
LQFETVDEEAARTQLEKQLPAPADRSTVSADAKNDAAAPVIPAPSRKKSAPDLKVTQNVDKPAGAEVVRLDRFRKER